MSYSSLTPLQFVSRNNLQNAVDTSVIDLNVGQTIPAGNRFITKQDALTYVNIDPTNTYLAAKTNIQLISKRDITALTGSGLVEVDVQNFAVVYSTNIPGFTITIGITTANSPYFGTHTSFTGILDVEISNSNPGDKVELYVNGTLIESLDTEGDNITYSFTSRTYNTTDNIKLYLYNSL